MSEIPAFRTVAVGVALGVVVGIGCENPDGERRSRGTGAEEEFSTMQVDRDRAAEQMREFAERTGLTSDRPPERYLWTDAFAVCNFVGLGRERDEERYIELAERLVDQVHQTLGKHRDDDSRRGWLSGLSGEEAEAHPTRGGLRIGKPLPEREAGEPIDRREEWERDGQYFHYNTKWMHALDVLARATGEEHYNRWARELAEASHEGFVHRPDGGGPPQMYWKMRIDLSAPLVETMGQHDPLDGYGVYRQLRATASQMEATEEPELEDAIESFRKMVRGGSWGTSDALGLGGLLMQAHREAWLLGETDAGETELLGELLGASRRGVQRYARGPELDRGAGRRLAFRELGLAIGLYGARRMHDSAVGPQGLFAEGSSRRTELDALAEHFGLRERIVSYWRDAGHREAASWREHRDINQVMLATALAPEGCLAVPSVD